MSVPKRINIIVDVSGQLWLPSSEPLPKSELKKMLEVDEAVATYELVKVGKFKRGEPFEAA